MAMNRFVVDMFNTDYPNKKTLKKRRRIKKLNKIKQERQTEKKG